MDWNLYSRHLEIETYIGAISWPKPILYSRHLVTENLYSRHLVDWNLNSRHLEIETYIVAISWPKTILYSRHLETETYIVAI